MSDLVKLQQHLLDHEEWLAINHHGNADISPVCMIPDLVFSCTNREGERLTCARRLVMDAQQVTHRHNAHGKAAEAVANPVQVVTLPSAFAPISLQHKLLGG